MKMSLKTVLVAALLSSAALTSLSFAQDDKPAAPPAGDTPRGGGGGRRGGMFNPDQMVSRLDEAVTLTADQKTKATEIYKKMVADMQALPQDQRREKGPEIGKTAHDDIRALLTPDQQKKFDAMPQPGRGGRGGRPPRDGGNSNNDSSGSSSSSNSTSSDAPKKTE
jgi:protein CpxP